MNLYIDLLWHSLLSFSNIGEVIYVVLEMALQQLHEEIKLENQALWNLFLNVLAQCSCDV